MSAEDLGRLRIVGELGRGAMGVVHRAFDPTLGREVAVKMLLQGSAARFEREGVISATLAHPGIVPIHSAGVRDGRPCLVYELIPEARTLDQALRSSDLRTGVALLRDVARALGHAHARGVVHRDVKPGNVLVGTDGRARVMDFGIAAAKELDRLTVTGTILGTPSYMAPETLAQQRGQVGPPADVWAVGVMLHEWLSGELPFQAATLLELAVCVVETQPPPLDARRASPPLRAICGRALAKAPADRYPTGDALADDLDAFLEARPVSAIAPAAPGRRGLAGLALALGVLVLLVIGAGLSPRDSSPPSAPDPPAPPSPAPPDPAVAWRGIEGLGDRLAQHLAARAWLSENPAHALAGAARRLEASLARSPLARLSPTEGGGDMDVAALGGGRWLAASDATGEVTCWDGRSVLWRRRDAQAAGGVVRRGDGALWWGGPGLGLWWTDRLDGVAAPAHLAAGDGTPRSVAIASDGRLVAIAPVDPVVILVDLTSGRVSQRLVTRERAHGLGFAPDGSWVAACTGSMPDGAMVPTGTELLVWDTGTGACLGRADVSDFPIALAVAPDGRTIAVATGSGDVLLFDARAGSPRSVPPALTGRTTLPGAIHALAWRADGGALTAASCGATDDRSAGWLASFDPASGACTWKARLEDPVIDLDASPDGALLVLGTRAGGVVLWADRP